MERAIGWKSREGNVKGGWHTGLRLILEALLVFHRLLIILTLHQEFCVSNTC